MIYAVMDGNVVQNTIVADNKFVDEFYPTAIDITDVEPRPSIGWSYDGKKFTIPQILVENVEG